MPQTTLKLRMTVLANAYKDISAYRLQIPPMCAAINPMIAALAAN
jgi:hypothetical protein